MRVPIRRPIPAWEIIGLARAGGMLRGGGRVREAVDCQWRRMAKTMRMKSGRLWIGLALLGGAVTVAAAPPKNITGEERALLPPYCRYTQGGHVGFENPSYPSPTAKYWVGVFGGQGLTAQFWMMHHYCYALIHMMRGQRPRLSEMAYRGEWMEVIGEIDFILNRGVPPDFILLPEMMLNRGRALVRLKQFDAALKNFEKAIEAKPDYWPPYAEIAELHVHRGDKARAFEVLRSGLAAAPGAEALRKRLSDLGGGVAGAAAGTDRPAAAGTSPGSQ